jgi:hypothetical protein
VADATYQACPESFYWNVSAVLPLEYLALNKPLDFGIRIGSGNDLPPNVEETQGR